MDNNGTPKLTRADIRRMKADLWSAYKIPVEIIELTQLVSDDPNPAKRRHATLVEQTVRRAVPALYEKDAKGHLTRLPLRAERRAMWRKATRG